MASHKEKGLTPMTTPRRNTAKICLENMLYKGPLTVIAITKIAKVRGISRRTLHRAKAELGVQAIKDGPIVNGERTWRWHPPTHEPWEGDHWTTLL
jgi:hypothetical protein